MLKSLYIDNFRTFTNFKVGFADLTLVMGYNGSGKTNLFRVLSCIRAILSGDSRVRDALPPSTRTRWDTRAEQSIELVLEGPHGELTYRLVVQHDQSERKARILKEELGDSGGPLFQFIDGHVQLFKDEHTKGPEYSADGSQSALAPVLPGPGNKKLSWFKDSMKNMIVCSPQPGMMSSDALSEDTELDFYATNFASWFNFLSLEHQDRIVDLTNELRGIVDGFHGFKLSQAGAETRILEVGFLGSSNRSPKFYQFKELSDGEREILLLYTLAIGMKGLGYSLFLDEPENFLATSEIQPFLMTLQQACGEDIPQAVLISHHPELIDLLAPEASVWLERAPGGPTRIGELKIPPESPLKVSEHIGRGWVG